MDFLIINHQDSETKINANSFIWKLGVKLNLNLTLWTVTNVFFLKETFVMSKNSPEEVEKKMKTTDQENLSKCFQCA